MFTSTALQAARKAKVPRLSHNANSSEAPRLLTWLPGQSPRRRGRSARFPLDPPELGRALPSGARLTSRPGPAAARCTAGASAQSVARSRRAYFVDFRASLSLPCPGRALIRCNQTFFPGSATGAPRCCRCGCVRRPCARVRPCIAALPPCPAIFGSFSAVLQGASSVRHA